MTPSTKALLVAVVIAGAGAAAWFLYLEDWLTGGPAPVAPAKPPASVAKAPASQPASKLAVAEAPKPAAAEAPKPAAAEAPKPAAASVAMAPAPEPAKPAAAPKEPPKPKAAEAPKPMVAEAPKPMAAEPPKPMAAEPPKLEPKPGAEAPAQEAAPREAPAPVPVAMRSARVTPGPKYNDLATAVLYRDAKAVEELIAFGKWPEKADSRGITPLMLAALLGEAGMAESLLKAGANPNRPGPGGATATSIARERSDTPILKLLQSHGGR